MNSPQELDRALSDGQRDAFVSVVPRAVLADMVEEVRAELAPLDWSADTDHAIGQLSTLLALPPEAHRWLWVWATDVATHLAAQGPDAH